MDGFLVKGSIAMPRGSMLRIDDGASMLVYVWEGELWLTQEGSRKDHMLQAGQWFRVDRDGAALAHAFRNSVVSLSSPLPEVPAKRITLAQGVKDAPVVLHQRADVGPRQTLRRLFTGLFALRTTAGYG